MKRIVRSYLLLQFLAIILMSCTSGMPEKVNWHFLQGFRVQPALYK